MGNVTIAFNDDGVPQVYGNLKHSSAIATLAASYATGGDTIPAWSRAGNLAQLLRARIVDHGNNGYKLALDSRTAPTKILAFWSGGAGAAFAEVTATTNLSTVSCEVEFEGY